MRVLVVDDNPDDRALVLRQVAAEFPDAETVELKDAAGLEAALDQQAPDLVVTDYALRWSSGLDILDQVKARAPDCPVVMFTGTGDEEVAVEAMKRGLDDYVVKSPRQLPRLRASLRQAVEAAARRVELRRNRDLLAMRERELEAAVAHKDLVLRELHHRVKNNLQTINALLWMRAKRAGDPRLRDDLNEMAQRMTALAQVQSRILDDGSLDRVDFGAVLADMATSLATVYADSPVDLRPELRGSLVLPVQRAMPLGLICYELIVNSFKHAFPDGRKGNLDVRLEGTGNGKGDPARIVIADDGVGYAPNGIRAGLGLRIIDELAQEAGATLEREAAPGHGTTVTITLR